MIVECPHCYGDKSRPVAKKPEIIISYKYAAYTADKKIVHGTLNAATESMAEARFITGYEPS
jgi:hypothetical protein